MDNEKIENLLNLALDASSEEVDVSPALFSGKNPSGTWTIIVRYVGTLEFPADLSVKAVRLLGGYAILEVFEDEIPRIAEIENILYIEKPKNLVFAVLSGRRASCVSAVQNQFENINPPGNLYGTGCIIGIADSGIEYENPVFMDAQGRTRILGIWDQTLSGTPPEGYLLGHYFNQNEIQTALDTRIPLPTGDFSGHGTGVASVAAGNFSTGALPLGMAVNSELLIVRLGTPGENSFPRTSELMQAVDFMVKEASRQNKPLVINLSFGNNYGSHTGSSLLETYLDIAASTGRTSIVTGSGNEGNAAVHTSGRISSNTSQTIPFYVSPYETGLSIQIWKAYYDTMDFSVTMPWGETFSISSAASVSRFESRGTRLLIYYGEPSPYEIWQEIFINFTSVSTYPGSGIYELNIQGKSVVQGDYYLWMPVQSELNGSRFLYPSPYATLTIPSTASRLISVGAYDTALNAYASFSGRGYEDTFPSYPPVIKPELAAPGVNITVAQGKNSTMTVSGTSFAAPFVSGAAALLMEWGIIKGNDPFLYGDKLKAYLLKGAKKLPGYEKYPNPYVGWGTLCVSDSIPMS